MISIQFNLGLSDLFETISSTDLTLPLIKSQKADSHMSLREKYEIAVAVLQMMIWLDV